MKYLYKSRRSRSWSSIRFQKWTDINYRYATGQPLRDYFVQSLEMQLKCFVAYNRSEHLLKVGADDDVKDCSMREDWTAA